MTITNRFDTVSPLDSRFYGGDPALYKALHPYLSAAAAIKYMARVEGALALALADVGITDKTTANAIASAADRITAGGGRGGGAHPARRAGARQCHPRARARRGKAIRA